MNKTRRNRLDNILASLEKVRDDLEEVRDDEQCAFDNLPDNIKNSERGDTMEENVNTLYDLYDSIDSLISDMNDFLEEI